MSQDYPYFECVYLDTNSISITVEHPDWYLPLFNFLFENHLYVSFSDALLVELGQATGKHADFNTFFTILPSAEIKSFEAVIDEEVESYPKLRVETLLRWPLSLESSKQTVTSWLSSSKIEEARRKQQRYARNVNQLLDFVKSNFPPSIQGKYSVEQAKVFAWMFTAQWLRRSHPEFMKRLNDNRRLLRAELFPSIQLFAYYVYYKCYLGAAQPKALSNFGDLFHLFYFPYCKLIVVKSDMCRILNKVKSYCNVLGGVDIKTMNFFSDNQVLKR